MVTILSASGRVRKPQFISLLDKGDIMQYETTETRLADAIKELVSDKIVDAELVTQQDVEAIISDHIDQLIDQRVDDILANRVTITMQLD